MTGGTYPTPTDTAYNDIEQYIPLLLGAISEELDRDEVWEQGEEANARSYIDDLITWISRLGEWLVPTGLIAYYPIATLPAGWLNCNGDAVSRSDYARLFSVIGTTYGAGNGTTTFNLPDIRGRTIVADGDSPTLSARVIGEQFGEESHTLTLAETPSHNHTNSTSTILAKQNGTAGTSNRLMRGTDANTNSNVVDQLVFTTTTKGSDGAHNNMQPSFVLAAAIYAR